MENKQEEFYNYIYLDPRKPGHYSYVGLNFSLLYEPFYVGKGKNDRYLNHIKEARRGYNKENNNYKTNKIRKIISNNYNQENYIIKLNYTNIEIDALDSESSMIKNIGSNYIDEIKDGPLTNLLVDNHLGLYITTKGKTYTEIYGEEKAKEQLKKRSGVNHYLFTPIKIYDKENNLVLTTTYGLKPFCKEHKLPYNGLLNSYRNKGIRLYMSTIGNTSKNNIKYKGWYCLRGDDVQDERFSTYEKSLEYENFKHIDFKKNLKKSKTKEMNKENSKRQKNISTLIDIRTKESIKINKKESFPNPYLVGHCKNYWDIVIDNKRVIVCKHLHLEIFCKENGICTDTIRSNKNKGCVYIQCKVINIHAISVDSDINYKFLYNPFNYVED